MICGRALHSPAPRHFPRGCRYCQLRSISPDEVKTWMLPMVALLSDGIAEEEQHLMQLVTVTLMEFRDEILGE